MEPTPGGGGWMADLIDFQDKAPAFDRVVTDPLAVTLAMLA